MPVSWSNTYILYMQIGVLHLMTPLDFQKNVAGNQHIFNRYEHSDPNDPATLSMVLIKKF